MATLRSKKPAPVGSETWIANERENALNFEAQDVEDFTYAARNEVEWLNEHMADIFSRNHIEVTEIFKTPGKLRGKTPRTARKRNPLEVRAPLTDVFAPNPKTIKTSTQPQQLKPVARFTVAEDPSNSPPALTNAACQYQDVDKENSRKVHDDEEEEAGDAMDVDAAIEKPLSPAKSQPSPTKANPLADTVAPVPVQEKPVAALHRDVETARVTRPQETAQRLEERIIPTQSLHNALNTNSTQISVDSAYVSQDTQTSSFQTAPVTQRNSFVSAQEDAVMSDAGSQSDDHSSPDRPVVRKSSLNFATLPAREPLATKKSVGARTSRTSQFEQLKGAPTTRVSQITHYADNKATGTQRNGESLEPVQAPEADPISSNGVPASSNLDVEARLHSKTSTQRLHDKISMLGQSQPRPTKSIPSLHSQQPLYPDLSTTEKRLVEPVIEKTLDHEAQSLGKSFDEDDDDWIPQRPTSLDRPTMIKSHSADVMEDISGKDSIGGLQRPQTATSDLNKPLPESPSRQRSPLLQRAQLGHHKSISTPVIPSPIRSGLAQDTASKFASASNPNLASTLDIEAQISFTPIGSPSGRRIIDGPISASKAKLSSILKSARGIFASSAGVSAQAKLETMSPRTMRVRESPERPLLSGVFSPSKEHIPGSDLFSRVNASLKDVSRIASGSSASPSKDEGRRTRSSTEREEKRREKEAKERQKQEDELSKARNKEAQKATAYRAEKERVASQESQRSQAKEQQKAPKPTVAEQPIRKSPRKIVNQQFRHEEPKTAGADIAMADAPASDVEGPEAQRSTQQSKFREPRRPMRPIKEMAPKSKPAPVSIRVGTVSQWEADHRKTNPVHPSNSALASSLHETLVEPSLAAPSRPVSVASKPITAASGNQQTFKSSVNSTAPKPRALLAAARKKEQEEKEAQRKAEQKRELERKRALQQQQEERRQELAQRKEAERQQRERAAQEEARRTAPKPFAGKKRAEPIRKVEGQRNAAISRAKPVNATLESDRNQQSSTQQGEQAGPRAPSRMNGPPPPRLVQEQQATRTINQPPINPARPPKRALNPDHAEDASVRPVTKTGVAYQQNEAKRRRTNEEAVETYEPRPPMAPPIRQSNVRTKETVAAKNLFPHGYTYAQSNTQNTSSSTHQAPVAVKPPSMVQASLQANKAAHPLDMAKFATAKIPFGENPAAANGMHKTPVRPAMATSKSSPRLQNGDSIELPEIATDSEDEDDEDFAVPDWAANSPIITDQLMRQDALNPEDVFGPIAPLHMEEIFRNKERHHRFRQRTSSANWSGQDRLTQEEISEDIRARERLRANGHWTYGLVREAKEGK